MNEAQLDLLLKYSDRRNGEPIDLKQFIRGEEVEEKDIRNYILELFKFPPDRFSNPQKRTLLQFCLGYLQDDTSNITAIEIAASLIKSGADFDLADDQKSTF